MARTSQDRTAELSALRDRCVAIVRFIAELGDPGDLFAQTEEAIHAAFERGDLRGLKMVSKDVDEWAKALSSSQRAKLDDVLRSRFGAECRNAKEEARELARILQRGTITDREEYSLLSRRADEICADGSKSGELEKINELLAAFEED